MKLIDIFAVIFFCGAGGALFVIACCFASSEIREWQEWRQKKNRY